MSNRLELHEILTGITKHVYFQPPESIKMNYPCIVYKLSDDWNRYADDLEYSHKDLYDVTLIHRDPDNEERNLIRQIKYCSFERFFISDNLNHYVYRLYF